MLEETKELLIKNVQEELGAKKEKKEKIYQEIEAMSKERNQVQEKSSLALVELNQQIEELNKNIFQKIFGSKKLTNLCNEYTALKSSAIEEIKQIDEKIESLHQELYHLAHDETSIDKKMEALMKATSLEELGLTEKQALDYIKEDEKKVVRAVFRDIQKQSIETSTDIDRNMNALYQASISPFVVAIQNMKLGELIKELVDIGIVVDQDKIEYIGKINSYISSVSNLSNSSNPKFVPYPDIQGQERTDRLDNNFYNQVQQDLAQMQHYNSYPPLAISKIVTLAVLVSMAKENKREKQRIKEEERTNQEEKKGIL